MKATKAASGHHDALACDVRPLAKGSNLILMVFMIFSLAIIRLILLDFSSTTCNSEGQVVIRESGYQPLKSSSIVETLTGNISKQSFKKGSSRNSNTPPNFVVLLTSSDGFYDMWENWLAFFAKLEIPNLPVHLFAEDKITFERCLEQLKRIKNGNITKYKAFGDNKSKYVVDLSCLSWETVFSLPSKKKIGAASYSSNQYAEMMSHRPFIIQKELEKGFVVIFSDLDAIWVKSPLPYIEEDFKTIPENDNEMIEIWAQLDPSKSKKFANLCPGFMVYRPTSKVSKLVEKWGNLTTQGEKLERNQKAFNQLIWHPEEYNMPKIVTKSLPMNLFVNGALYFTKMTDEERKKAVVVHNNCIKGYDKKIDRFRNVSLWVAN
ncbi:hypothetical protein ACHAXS_000349 [Conticribra weissflogii]